MQANNRSMIINLFITVLLCIYIQPIMAQKSGNCRWFPVQVDIRKASTWSRRCTQNNFFAPRATHGPFVSSNSEGVATVFIKIRYDFALAANFNLLPHHTLLFSTKLAILKNVHISRVCLLGGLPADHSFVIHSALLLIDFWYFQTWKAIDWGEKIQKFRYLDIHCFKVIYTFSTQELSSIENNLCTVKGDTACVPAHKWIL